MILRQPVTKSDARTPKTDKRHMKQKNGHQVETHHRRHPSGGIVSHM